MNKWIKKLIFLFGTIIVISFLVFFSFQFISGDPAISLLGTQATPQRVEALREELGLNQPFLVQYAKWIISLLKGEMGISYMYSVSVGELILDKLPITLTLSLLSLMFMIIISIPFGIFTARNHEKIGDMILYPINQIIMAVPPFFSGILITFFFGIVLKWFVPGGYVSYEKDFLGFVSFLVFPAFAIALPKAAMAGKLLRSSVLEEMQKDYVKTAYSKGNTSKAVFYSHIFKNAFMPVLTFFGLALADMLAGSIIMEQVFNIPGIGRTLFTAISGRDYPVVQGIIVIIAFFVITINFLVDILYTKIDKRITL